MRPYSGDVKLDMLNARRFPPEYASLLLQLAGYGNYAYCRQRRMPRALRVIRATFACSAVVRPGSPVLRNEPIAHRTMALNDTGRK